MSTEIATKDNQAYVARYAATEDPFLAFAGEGGPGIQGKLLTCKKGEWTIGADGDRVKEDALFLLVVPTMMRGWMKWVDGKVADARVGLVADGFVVPHRLTLGDEDQEAWETDPTGSPRDPWSQTYRVQLIELAAPHGDVTFSGSSFGAKNACQEMCRVYRADGHLYPDAFPVVSLTTKSRPHKTYGKIIGPWFGVQGWATVEDVKAGRKRTAKAASAPANGFNEAVGDELPDWGK